MKKLLLILALLSTFTFAQRSYVVVPLPQYTVIEKGNATDLYLQWDDTEQKYIPLDVEDFSIAIRGYYKEYIALLTQSGTDAPVATVFRNTIGTVNFSRIQEGRYAIEFSGVSPTANFYSPQVIANGDDNIKYANSYPIYDLDGRQNLVGTVYLHKSDNPSLLNIVTTDGTGNEFDGILQKGIFLHFIVYE